MYTVPIFEKGEREEKTKQKKNETKICVISCLTEGLNPISMTHTDVRKKWICATEYAKNLPPDVSSTVNVHILHVVIYSSSVLFMSGHQSILASFFDSNS